VSFVGGLLVLLAVLLFVVNLAVSLASRPDEEVVDPWDGQTLEWAVPSPPGGVLPDLGPVRSAEPLLDAKGSPQPVGSEI